MRIHIFGGSGSGTSTLGRAVATRLATQHFDTDDFFWLPSDPPFQKKRDIAARLDLMQKVFVPRRDWVLSGSLTEWGSSLIPRFDLVVLLTLDPSVRLARLSARETLRGGIEIEEGCVGHQGYRELLEWARGYDSASFRGRNQWRHNEWFADLPCPTLMLDSALPVEQLVSKVDWALDADKADA